MMATQGAQLLLSCFRVHASNEILTSDEWTEVLLIGTRFSYSALQWGLVIAEQDSSALLKM